MKVSARPLLENWHVGATADLLRLLGGEGSTGLIIVKNIVFERNRGKIAGVWETFIFPPPAPLDRSECECGAFVDKDTGVF